MIECLICNTVPSVVFTIVVKKHPEGCLVFPSLRNYSAGANTATNANVTLETVVRLGVPVP
jgi:hypothetical protein